MKKRLNDIFFVSRNERIGLICIIIIIGIILLYQAFKPTGLSNMPILNETEEEFQAHIKSIIIDTVPKEKRKRKKAKRTIKTVSSLEKTSTKQ